MDPLDVLAHPALKKIALESMQQNTRESEDQADKIVVYVRLRPLSRKENDSGAKCCLKAGMQLSDVAPEFDYLRLKRLKGTVFCIGQCLSRWCLSGRNISCQVISSVQYVSLPFILASKLQHCEGSLRGFGRQELLCVLLWCNWSRENNYYAWDSL